MVRPLRIEFPGAIYHLTSRGNARLPVFEDTGDREVFLTLIEEIVNRFHWLCHAYCLMDNHYHLLVETVDGNLSCGMRHLNGVYTQHFNRRHQRVGHVFQGRFKSMLVQRDSYLLEVCRYVVLNPVRAGMVKGPEEYTWSSYRATSGVSEAPPFLTVDWILSQFAANRQEAQELYREFVQAGITASAPWEGSKSRSILGDQTFIDAIEPALKERALLKEVPREDRLAFRPSLEQLLGGERGKDKDERNRAILSAHLHYGYTLAEIGTYLGFHYTTISKIVKQFSSKTDNSRPDPEFYNFMNKLYPYQE